MNAIRGRKYDAVVIGGGHAGAEAARAIALAGFCVALVTRDGRAIGRMSCNPSVGGVGKGHLVREIDALGGLMGKTADRTGIQFRILNASKGAAVQGLRCQSDREAYSAETRRVVSSMGNIEVIEGEAVELEVSAGEAKAVIMDGGLRLVSSNVVLAAGTFMRGKLFVGLEETRGGRINEPPSDNLSRNLEKHGLEFHRLKTGTPARLKKDTIDWKAVKTQAGDRVPEPFCLFSSPFPAMTQVPCHTTYTTKETAEIVKTGLDRSPLYRGLIKGIGPRYCPSLEDKIVKFPHHERHLVFLEPDGIDSEEIYPNGISTSLPEDIQEKFIRSVPGLEKAEIITPGYAVEYDFLQPTALDRGLCCKTVEGLYFAGQVIGTTGYEEAAGLGLYAGYNIIRKLKGEEPFRLERSASYLGVMVDDLVTRGVMEPYRLFTSRAEYRMLLDRHTAYRRLGHFAEREGLIEEEEASFRRERELEFQRCLGELQRARVKGGTLRDRLKRSDSNAAEIMTQVNADDPFMTEYVVSEIRNEGYRKRFGDEARKTEQALCVKIPPGLDLRKIPGLSAEIVDRLSQAKPETLLHASRIPGITPSALAVLRIELEKRRKK